MRCAVMGVFAPLVGIIGAMQAAEALKLLAGVGETLLRAAAAARRAEDGVAVDPAEEGSGLPVCAAPVALPGGAQPP